MTNREPCKDDVTDIIENSKKIEELLKNIFEENDFQISLSSFLSAIVNVIFYCSLTIDEVKSFKKLICKVIDDCIKHAESKK